MRDISTIADDPALACIWRKDGRTAHLFRFIADRFAGAPDSVGFCESIHAQWKWLEVNRRGMKFKLLNSLLKLRNYVTTYESLPPLAELQEHIDVVDMGLAALYRNIREAGDTSVRQIRDAPFLERFNLRGVDVPLLHAADGSEDHDGDATNNTLEVSWGNYVRFLFDRHNVYCFTAMAGTPHYFYVAENKSVAYRDAPKQGAAIGRAISLIWLEKCPDQETRHDELSSTEEVFVPCSGEECALYVADLSLADISLASGYYPPDVQPFHSDRDVEVLHEKRFLDHNVERFDSRRASAAEGSAWKFIVDTASGVDLEWWSFEHRDLGAHTKMSLARQLQARDNLTDDERDRSFSTLTRQALLAALRLGPGPAIAPIKGRGRGGRGAAPAAVAPVKGRGRGGRGAPPAAVAPMPGRGRGKGRGGAPPGGRGGARGGRG